MAKSVFFSFHYDDVINWKANIVRNNSEFKKGNDDQYYFRDGSIWEDRKPTKKKEIEEIINKIGLHNTSITSVLIGTNTYQRKWVKYELVRSFARGNGILAVHINKLKGRTKIEKYGKNPLDCLRIKVDETGEIYFEELIKGKWKSFNLFPSMNNNKSNSVFFRKPNWLEFFTEDPFGKTFKFSHFFKTYCWVRDDGNNNFINWIEESHKRRQTQFP